MSPARTAQPAVAAVRRAVAAMARAHRPHAAKAPNTASADTDIQIAAGPRTRKGAAFRRAPLRTEAPEREQHRDGCRRCDNGHDETGRESAAQTEAYQEHEEQQGAGRMPRDVHRPVVG